MSSPPPTDLSPRAREIVAAARVLLEREGAAALSMRRLGHELGIRAPSIYKHLPGKRALEAAIVSDGFAEQAAAFSAALAAAPAGEGLAALARAYRAFAQAHPHLYRLMYDRPLDRERLAPGAEERAAAPVVRAAGGDPDLARACFAFAHGMTMLELGGRFPPGADLDAAWARGIAALRG